MASSDATTIATAAHRYGVRPDTLAGLYGPATSKARPVEPEPSLPTRDALSESRATAKPAERLGQELAQLVASGIIRSAGTFQTDLEKRISTVEDAIQHPEHYGTKTAPGGLRAARDTLAMLRGARHPRIAKNAATHVEGGLRYADAMKQGLNVHAKALLDRAALSDYALAHLGAGHGQTEAQVRAHVEAHGRNPDALAYVPHVVGAGRKPGGPFASGPVLPGVPRNVGRGRRR